MIKNLTIDEVTKYIEEHIEMKKIDIDELVSYTGYSRRYLQKLFKDKVGCSIGKYIQLRRISKAAILLRLSGFSISNISAKLCYDSQQSFTREFKKNTGYTPLQYRKTKVWSFNNMTGYRKTGDLFSAPKMYHLDRMVIDGFIFTYKEKLTYNVERSKVRSREIDKRFIQTIFTSNKVSSDKLSVNDLLITTVIWTNSVESNTQLIIPSGMYACFSFTGTHEEYLRFNYHIYSTLLSFYKLSKREGFDIEIISREDDSSFTFHYYLPVVENENFYLSYDDSPFPLIYPD
ncbi:helix-turn-helix domain-containing protein [Salmonella enterica]|nr:helix-turn-helix domain-containing protein [Salmonella enterica]